MITNCYYLYGIAVYPPAINWQDGGIWHTPISHLSQGGITLLYSILQDQRSLPFLHESRKHMQPRPVMSIPQLKHQLLQLEIHRSSWKFLPFPYGTTLDISHDLRQFLQYNQTTILQSLEKSKDACEYHLELSFEYRYVASELFAFNNRQQDRQIAQLKALNVIRLLNVLAPDTKVGLQLPDAESYHKPFISILTDINHIEATQRACETVLKHFKNLSLRITGPWPPYSLLPDFNTNYEEKQTTSLANSF